MKYSVFERNLVNQLEEKIRDVTPGVVVRAYQNGRLVCDIAAGTTYPYYDLASLTKIIFTTQAMLVAYENEKWNFETKVKEILSWFPSSDTTVLDLMNHSSGLIWWKPIYKSINLENSLEQRREQLKNEIINSPIEKSDVSVYSDIGFMTVGFLLESFFDRPLLDVWNEMKNKFYNGTTLEFHPQNQFLGRANLYAPTEECPWRGRLLQGEVHDENCWAIGGVSTHAGLFGSIDDMGWYLLHLRSQLMGIARYSVKQKTMKLFAQRSRPLGGGDWAVGYMMPTPGASSCGNQFSLDSIGHTGFTGTSLWYDPKFDLGISILSNRLVYGRENKSFAQLRPQIHNWIVEGLRKSSY